jgi:hypothetical protein
VSVNMVLLESIVKYQQLCLSIISRLQNKVDVTKFPSQANKIPLDKVVLNLIEIVLFVSFARLCFMNEILSKDIVDNITSLTY